MLPADAGLDVARLHARALTLLVVVELDPIRNVVERRRLVVQVGEIGLHRRRAGEHRSAAALGEARRVERQVLRRERRPTSIESSHCSGIVGVKHIVLVQIVGLERDMPLLVELVVRRQAVPLQVVVTPCAAVDRVGDDIDAVVAGIAGPAHATGDARHRTRILQHGGAGEQRVGGRVGDLRVGIPRH
ncbi:hypothetical protein NS44R_14955, partial [Mammaliicoccus sciuri]